MCSSVDVGLVTALAFSVSVLMGICGFNIATVGHLKIAASSVSRCNNIQYRALEISLQPHYDVECW
jgi:hypothetical protein